MHHEGWYSQCADYLTQDLGIDPEDSLPCVIERVLGAEIPETARAMVDAELTALLDSWHERGLLRPNETNRTRGYVPLGGENTPPLPKYRTCPLCGSPTPLTKGT